MGQQMYRRAAQLLEAEIDDELVALDSSLGVCFGFNSVATSVWRLLEEPKTGSEIKAFLLDSYDVQPAQCDAEVDELLESMVEHGIVARA